MASLRMAGSINLQRTVYNLQGIVHLVKFDKFYHLSWLETGLNTTFNWDEARNYCRRFCMDAIAFESFDEVLEFNSIIENGQILIVVLVNVTLDII
jgi:hypothetical protein